MENKELNKAVLVAYGFTEQAAGEQPAGTVMSKDQFHLVIQEDGSVAYTNMGFQYPLKDVAALQKLYKEVKREVLTEVASSFKGENESH